MSKKAEAVIEEVAVPVEEVTAVEATPVVETVIVDASKNPFLRKIEGVDVQQVNFRGDGYINVKDVNGTGYSLSQEEYALKLSRE